MGIESWGSFVPIQYVINEDKVKEMFVDGILPKPGDEVIQEVYEVYEEIAPDFIKRVVVNARFKTIPKRKIAAATVLVCQVSDIECHNPTCKLLGCQKI